MNIDKLNEAFVNIVENDIDSVCLEHVDSDREEMHRRLTNKHRSHAAEQAWQRHRSNYNRGIRSRERANLSSIYADNEKDESLNANMTEAEILTDNIFELHQVLDFKNIAGGISFDVDGNSSLVNFTVSLDGEGTGSYKPQTNLDEAGLRTLYREVKQELTDLCNHFDEEIQQIIAKHGLAPTK